MTEQAPPEAVVEEPAAPPRPWAEVTPEQFRMLRLSPLPADRASGPRPLRFVQFGMAERHDPALSLLRLDIQLPAQRVRSEQNRLDVWVDHQLRQVSLGSDAGLQLEPVNRGLGRFVMAHAAAWLQRHWPHYTLQGAALSSKEALQPAGLDRRDHALRTQGLNVEYADVQRLKGQYHPIAVSQLLSTWNAEKVQMVEVLAASEMLQMAEQQLQEMELRLHGQQERIGKFSREESGLRFTIACLIAFAVFQAALLIWIATHR
ncbi:hypothetical protein [Pseudomonas sp. CFBP 13719]|uniref:hypothetical protein n=1 Tax=Pseudomonas sp. CFBP 13719 TaxID=2775303 RepID=UPI00177C0E28|nr:hypothetical protein [Pseudomonas sp. CFBP 13719]MBD8684313.1 hypothetical protein [Pseudomonas sp. CFBP 13719]